MKRTVHHSFVRAGLTPVVLAGLLAACGSSSTSSKTTATTVKPVAASAAASPTTRPVVTSSPATATTKAAAVGLATSVELGTTSLGKVLVDSAGHTLYLSKQDTPSKASACNGACATTWKPLETTGSVTAGSGLEAAKVGTITRSDGTKQVTYNGWPLYRYDGDTTTGDTKGQKVANQWYVVDAAGAAVGG